MTFLEEYQRRLGEWSDVQYCMPWMLDTATGYEEVRVLELGVRSGNSTSAFLAAAETRGIPGMSSAGQPATRKLPSSICRSRRATGSLIAGPSGRR